MTRTVRRATTDDAESIQNLARESWHAAYADFLGSETVETVVDDWYAVDGLEESITDAADRSDAVFLVAEADDDSGSDGDRNDDGDGDSTGDRTLVGFVHAVPGSDDRTVASLLRLYVHPDRWGDGTGTALLERAIDGLETGGDSDADYERLELEVFADNEVGVRFYESSGFERTGEHEEVFAGDTQTVYIYERPLGGE